MDNDHPLLGLSQRLPPQNQAAEHALLGAILANNRAFEKVEPILRAEHFYDPIHQHLYAEISNIISQGRVADPVSLLPWFGAHPDVADVGGVGYLAQLLSAMVGIINVDTYARSIRDCWAKREVIEIAREMVEKAFAEKLEAQAIISDSVEALEGTVARSSASESTLAQAAGGVFDDMDAAMKGQAPALYATGLPDLDNIIGGGLRAKHLTVLGGRPGHGKTALARQISLFIASEYNVPVLFVSLEMTAKEQAAGALSLSTGISASRIEMGRVNPREADQVLKAINNFKNLPIMFDDRPRLTMAEIRMAVRRFRRKYGMLGLVVVDHLHLVKFDAKTIKLGLVFAVGDVANQLKEMAKDEDVAVLALAQLNRGKESQDDKIPTLGDLKNSGDIEAAADKVFFTHRAELHLHKASPTRKPNESDSDYAARESAYKTQVAESAGIAELISAKVRQGPTGTVKLRFHGETTSFLPLI